MPSKKMASPFGYIPYYPNTPRYETVSRFLEGDNSLGADLRRAGAFLQDVFVSIMTLFGILALLGSCMVHGIEREREGLYGEICRTDESKQSGWCAKYTSPDWKPAGQTFGAQ